LSPISSDRSSLCLYSTFPVSGRPRRALGVAAVKIAYNKTALTFGEALWRGIGCNWLVCLAVWMALAARQIIGKIFAIFFPIMPSLPSVLSTALPICTSSNGIMLMNGAGFNSVPGVDPNILGWVNFLWRNLLPVTIGNIIGGAVFVGMSYWGPTSDRRTIKFTGN